MTLATYLIRRIADDPRVAWHFDPITQSMELLTAAYAEEHGLDVEEFRKKYYASLKFERPQCRDCREDA
jgi:hypothetical protein